MTEANKTKAVLVLVLSPQDTVATVLQDIRAGSSIALADGRTIQARGDIPRFHKFALEAHEKGDEVLKYGQIIGVARCAIAQGDHVHTHNLISNRAVSNGPDNEPVGHSRWFKQKTL